MVSGPLMRAAVVAGPRAVSFVDVPVPEPGPRQVRVRVEGCGVCGSNLGPWRGLPWLRYPLDPGAGGHEAWGVVDAVGEDVVDVRVGDRVAALSYAAWAPYDVADEAAVVKLPAALDQVAFPGEALACAMNVHARSRIRTGDVVAVVGIGFLGAALVRLAAQDGATVIAISRRASSLALATSLGAEHVVRMGERWEIVEAVRRITGERLCDVVIEAVGSQEALDVSADLTAERGTLVVAGYHQDGPRQVNLQQWNWRGFDVVNAHERDPRQYAAGLRRAVEAAVDGRLDPRPLVTHAYPLAELARALDDCDTKPEGFVKAVVIP